MKALLCFLVLWAIALPMGAASFHTPVSITAPNSTAYYPVQRLYQGPGVGYSATSPHDAIAGGSQTWVTDQPNGGSGDYYANGKPAPILVIDLGADRYLTEISTWGYSSTNTNGVRTFNLRFATAAEGSSGFGNSIPAQTGFTADLSATTRHSHPLAPVIARYVEFTATDNWRGQAAFSGGDRVGLGEIAFENTGGLPDSRLEAPAAIGLDLDGTLQSFVVDIHNAGTTQPLTISSATFTGPQAAAFTLSQSPAPIAPGTTGAFQFSFNPSGLAGTISATLQLASNDPVTPVTSIALSGFLHDPKLAVAATLDFGVLAPGSAVKVLPLALSNAGTGHSLNLGVSTLGGPDAARFKVLSQPASIPPSGNGQVELSFTPCDGEGEISASLTLATNDVASPLTIVNLKARCATIDPAPVLRINEFAASNSSGLEDGDGSRSDWIEIFNAGTSPVDLGGWHLTDKADNLTKWTFPSRMLGAGEYLVVFASGQDAPDYVDPQGNLHTNFNLSAGGEYLGLIKPDGVTIVSEFHPAFPAQFGDVSYGTPQSSSATSNVIAGAVPSLLVPSDGTLALTWTQSSFTPGASWFAGTGQGIGYDSSDGYLPYITTDVKARLQATPKPGIYIRLPFTIADKSAITALSLPIRYDDGFVAYLNGQEIATRNAPATPLWNSTATGFSSPEPAQETIDVSAYLGALRNGDNVLAIHGMNISAGEEDFLIAPELRATMSVPSAGAPGYLAAPTPGAANTAAFTPGPSITEVTPNPLQPVAGQATVITAYIAPRLAPVTSAKLSYRVMYEPEVTLTMVDDGTAGDEFAGDWIFTAAIPASAHNTGNMLRWSVFAADSNSFNSRAPVHLDSTGEAQSAEYFGTMIPDPAVTSGLPQFHWFTRDTAASHTRSGARASVFFAGQFYDNIFVRQRGGATNAAVSQKFDFNKGEPLYIDGEMPAVGEININGNGSDSTYVRQPLAFETYRNAGNAACNSALWQMRVNNTADRVGVFVEQVDEDFLARNGYDAEGELYKMVGRSDLNPGLSDTLNGYEKKTGTLTSIASLTGLVSGLNLPTSDDRRRFVIDQLDLPQVTNYLALRSITQDADDVRKNFYVYQDARGDQRWRIFPWDKDWTFGVTGDGGTWLPHPFFGDEEHTKQNANQWNLLYDVIFEETTTQRLYLRRLRTLMDTVLQAPTLENRAAAIIAPASPPLSNNVSSINGYLASRRSVLLNNYTSLIPAAQPANPAVVITAADFNPASHNQDHEYIQLTNSEATEIDVSGWSLSGGVDFTFAQGTVIERGGSLYVSPDTLAFRQRLASPTGNEERLVVGPYDGHLSNFGETLALHNAAGTVVSTYQLPYAPSAAQLYLVVTEVMYHPEPDGDAEFIELMNTSSSVTLDLTGVRFANGIGFAFPAGTTLAPGSRILVVKSAASFHAAYGQGIAVAGEYAPSSLNNAGETIELVDGDGSTICKFTYGDVEPWPSTADGDGFSLHYIAGEPGSPSSWFAFTPDPGIVLEDSDGDGQSNRIESLAGSDPGNPFSKFRILEAKLLPAGSFAGSFSAAAGHRYRVEQSADLKIWTPVGADMIPEANGPCSFNVTIPAGQTGRFYRVAALAMP